MEGGGKLGDHVLKPDDVVNSDCTKHPGNHTGHERRCAANTDERDSSVEDTGITTLQEKADKTNKSCGQDVRGHTAAFSGVAGVAKVNVLPSSDSAKADRMQPVERCKPAQPIWTNSGSGESVGAAAWLSPKKTIAEQILEVSERLDKIFELPVV